MINPGGLVLMIGAVWIGCQVFGGDGLTRLGILPKAG